MLNPRWVLAACAPCASLLLACSSDPVTPVSDTGRDVSVSDVPLDSDDATAADATDAADIDATADTAPELPLTSPWSGGPFEFSTTTATIPISDDGEVEATVYLPDRTGAAPAVIFVHGFQLTGDAFASYGERLASWGFVAVLPTMGDTLLEPRTHRQLAADTALMVDWLVADPTISPRVDPTRIAAGGHSRGGKQSLFAASLDSRIVASFNLDPVDSAPPFGGDTEDFPSVAPERMGDVQIPTGFVGAVRAAEEVFGQQCAPTEDNYRAYYEAATSPSFVWTIPEAGHLDFLDACEGFTCQACVAGEDPEWVARFSRGTMTAFYLVYLAGDDRFADWLDGAEFTEAAAGRATVEQR